MGIYHHLLLPADSALHIKVLVAISIRQGTETKFMNTKLFVILRIYCVRAIIVNWFCNPTHTRGTTSFFRIIIRGFSNSIVQVSTKSSLSGYRTTYLKTNFLLPLFRFISRCRAPSTPRSPSGTTSNGWPVNLFSCNSRPNIAAQMNPKSLAPCSLSSWTQPTLRTNISLREQRQ